MYRPVRRKSVTSFGGTRSARSARPRSAVSIVVSSAVRIRTMALARAVMMKAANTPGRVTATVCTWKRAGPGVVKGSRMQSTMRKRFNGINRRNVAPRGKRAVAAKMTAAPSPTATATGPCTAATAKDHTTATSTRKRASIR